MNNASYKVNLVTSRFNIYISKNQEIVTESPIADVSTYEEISSVEK